MQQLVVGSRQRRTNGRTVALVLAVLLAIGIAVFVSSRGAGASSVAGAEQQLRHGFLEPMGRAGISVDVLDACHYDRQTQDDPWHLAVKIATAASVPDVATVLRRAPVVVRDNGGVQIIQQFTGRPNKGWNGIIETQGDRSIVALVKNNVHTNDGSLGVGWLPICPESRATAHP